jgi:hypothetical protein
MLRRPGDFHRFRPEEGCSSTAFGACAIAVCGVWRNRAGRGSPQTAIAHAPAVP